MGRDDYELNDLLNNLLVKLFKDINNIEEKAMQTDVFKGVTTNDMHVIDAIGPNESKNMSTVAKALSVTMGTLTISVNSLVKKGFVERKRSEEDRRVVLVSLTQLGKQAFEHHRKFHDTMIEKVTQSLDKKEQEILAKTLSELNHFFETYM